MQGEHTVDAGQQVVGGGYAGAPEWPQRDLGQEEQREGAARSARPTERGWQAVASGPRAVASRVLAPARGAPAPAPAVSGPEVLAMLAPDVRWGTDSDNRFIVRWLL